MNNIKIIISDRQRRNTTYTKISNSLLKLDLRKTSKIIFDIKDLINAPTEKERWNRILLQLQDLVFNLMYAQALDSKNMKIIFDVPIVELRYKNERYCMIH